MKIKHLLFALLLILLINSLVFAQNTYVPDDNFEQALIDLGYDTGELNDSVPTAGIDTISDLRIRDKNIADLTGIEDFNSLILLDCYNNNLSELNLNSNIYLESLVCSNNQIQNINLNLNTNLRYINCSVNNIVNLDLSYYSNLTSVYCSNNKLSSLNIQNGNNTNLMLNATSNPNLFCIQVDDSYYAYTSKWYKDQLTAYTVNCSTYNGEKLEMTYVPDDNFEQALIDANYDKGPLNDSVPTLAINTIEILNIWMYNIEDLTGIEDFLNLSELNMGGNKLKSLDLSQNKKLTVLNCWSNQISTLNLDANTELTYLHCQENNITDLNVRSNTKLIDLTCYDNNIEHLDLSANISLRYLHCASNKLKSLNIKNDNNSIWTVVDATRNPDLYCIQVDNAELTPTYNWDKDETASYSEDCSPQAGVPISEYNSLVDLYNSTNGDNWTNNTNWLDTTFVTVADWYGITVENGHVTKILLNENNLQNTPFENLVDLPELKTLEFLNNSLSGFDFSAIDSLHSLDTLILNQNSLIFNDIEPAFTCASYSNFSDNFYYQTQKEIDKNEVLSFALDSNHFITIQKEFISANDQFQWYKDGQPLEGKTNDTIYFSPVTSADSGAYHVEITNPGIPELILKSHNKWLGIVIPKNSGIPISEYNALVDFYNNLNGENWLRNDNWLDTINFTVNDWFGVTVEGGHVTQIYFDAYSNNNLEGSLPNSIKDFKELIKLGFVTESISGELPPGLFELGNLEELSFAECNISGIIPAEIGNLTKLRFMAFEANQLEGNIPAEIGNLTNLEFVSIFGNKLTGEIPATMGQLSNLYFLGLSYNDLSGSIPASLGDLTELQWLLLDNNQLSGTIPKELAKLTKIKKFTFENNQIGTNEPENKSAFFKSGAIEDNRQIPDELASLIEMDTFRLANNNIQFNDIEAIFSWDNFESFNIFIYAPQDSIGVSKTVQGEIGKAVTLSIDNYYQGNSDTYIWYKDGVILNNETNSTLILNNLGASDEGKYHCVVSNTVAQELTLPSRLITLGFQTAVGSGYFDLNNIEIYPNPAENKIHINTGNERVNLKVFNLAGTLLLQKSDFNSDWIDIEHFSKGVYIFRIENEDLGIINRKVVFR